MINFRRAITTTINNVKKIEITIKLSANDPYQYIPLLTLFAYIYVGNQWIRWKKQKYDFVKVSPMTFSMLY